MFKRSEQNFRSESESSDWDESKNQGVLVLAGRGVSNRFRHLHNDLLLLTPHSKKEQKVDTRKDLRLLQELAELSSCDHILLLESRNGQDYLWISKRNQGPTLRLSISSFSTCEELGVLGNFYRNTRFLINSSLHSSAENDALLNILSCVFSGGKDDCSSDKILSLYEHSGTVVLRTYHVFGEEAVEAGPRLGFDVDLMMKGCFSGEILFKKSGFISQ